MRAVLRGLLFGAGTVAVCGAILDIKGFMEYGEALGMGAIFMLFGLREIGGE